MKKILILLALNLVALGLMSQTTTRNQNNRNVVEKDTVEFFQVAIDDTTNVWYGRQTIVVRGGSGLPREDVSTFPIGDDATLDNYMKARYVQLSNLEALRASTVINNYERSAAAELEVEYQAKLGKSITDEMDALFFDNIAGNYTMVLDGVTDTDVNISRQGNGAALLRPGQGQTFPIIIKGQNKIVINNFYGQGNDAEIFRASPDSYGSVDGRVTLTRNQ